MRQLADAEQIRALMRSLSAEARADALVYLTGGATAVGSAEEIEPLLYRFPAVDAASFRRRVERTLR